MDSITSMTVFIFMDIMLLLWLRRYLESTTAAVEINRHAKSLDAINDIYSNIQPLNSFEWENAPVPPNATFKSKYYLTMGKTHP
jgi:hypothetical protein